MKAMAGLNLLFTFAAARTEWYKERTLLLNANDGAWALHFKASYDALHADNGFLYAYAAELNLAGKNQESQQMLSLLKGRMQNYDTEILAADNALSLGRWHEAEAHFQLAHLMVPVRFTPLYGLMQAYAQSGDTLQARRVARHLTEKRIKVGGAEVQAMIREAQNLLHEPFHGPMFGTRKSPILIGPSSFTNHLQTASNTSIHE